MGLNIEYLDGQTPLDEDEKEGLIIKSITTRQELNEFEQQNIEHAIEWLMRKKLSKEQILTELFIRDLHKRMFGEVWGWAGSFRKTNKNIGVDFTLISTQLKQLSDDCLFWIDNNSYPSEETAIIYKHRLVNIHCFSNGNGRHSRLMADIIMEKIYNSLPFTWSSNNLIDATVARSIYIKAIRKADKGDIGDLIEFAKS